jgi:hypothetical protein
MEGGGARTSTGAVVTLSTSLDRWPSITFPSSESSCPECKSLLNTGACSPGKFHDGVVPLDRTEVAFSGMQGAVCMLFLDRPYNAEGGDIDTTYSMLERICHRATWAECNRSGERDKKGSSSPFIDTICVRVTKDVMLPTTMLTRACMRIVLDVIDKVGVEVDDVILLRSRAAAGVAVVPPPLLLANLSSLDLSDCTKNVEKRCIHCDITMITSSFAVASIDWASREAATVFKHSLSLEFESRSKEMH